MEQALAVKRLVERSCAMTEDAVMRAFSNGTHQANRLRRQKVLETLDRFGEIIHESDRSIPTRAA